MKPWAFVMLCALVGALGMATITILDLRSSLELVDKELALYRSWYHECFSRCGP